MLTQGSQSLEVSTLFQITHVSQQVVLFSLCPKHLVASYWILPALMGTKMSCRKMPEEKGRTKNTGRSVLEGAIACTSSKQTKECAFPSGTFNVWLPGGLFRLIDLTKFRVGQLLQHCPGRYLVRSGVQEALSLCKDTPNPAKPESYITGLLQPWVKDYKITLCLFSPPSPNTKTEFWHLKKWYVKSSYSSQNSDCSFHFHFFFSSYESIFSLLTTNKQKLLKMR